MIDVKVLIGVSLALLGAVFLNVGKGLEKMKVHVFAQKWNMFRKPHRRDLGIWLLGMCMTASYGILQWGAMSFVSNPSLIVSMTGFGLVALVIFAVRVIGERVTRKEFVGIGIIVICTVLMPYFQSESTAVVMDLEAVNIEEGQAREISDEVRPAVTGTGKYRFLGQEVLEDALEKMELPRSGLSEKELVKLGNHLKVQRIIGGRVVASDQTHTVSLQIFNTQTSTVEKAVEKKCNDYSDPEIFALASSAVGDLFPARYNLMNLFLGTLVPLAAFVVLCAVALASKRLHGFSFGALSGFLNAIAALLTKVSWVHVGTNASVFEQLKYPFLYIALIFGIGATVLTQVGFWRDRAIIVVPTFMSVCIISPAVLEYFVFGNYLQMVQYIFMGGIIAGVIFLSLSTPEEILAVELEDTGAPGSGNG